MDLIDLGQRIKATRKSKGWSQTRLALAADISRARLEALENGRIAEMGFKSLLRILNALGLDFRLTDLNRHRPTLDDLRAEDERLDASGVGR
jgi:transcriptional regulator with XRE-family HTH domain